MATVTPMTSIAGLRGTDNFSAGERPENFRETILWLNPNGEAPLTALLSKMGSESTDDPVFHWFEEEQGHVRPQISGAHNSSVTTIALVAENLPAGITGSNGIVAGDILTVEDATVIGSRGEQLLVTAVATNSLTVVRGFAGSVAGTYTGNERMTKTGTVFAEGSGAPGASSRNPSEIKNYCQIFKTVVDITETARKTKLRTGDLEKNEKKRKMFDHSRDLEMSFLTGRLSLSTGSNSKPRRTTSGLLDFITTNNFLYNNTSNLITEDKFIDNISRMFDYDGQGAGDQRIAFCGNQALTTLNILARDSASTRINFDGYVSAYGMKLAQWTVPQGTIFLKTHPLFNVNPAYSDLLVAINPRGIKYRPLRDTAYKPNIQANDEDTFKGQWITEAGLEVNHEKTMTVMGGLKVANLA